jgi:hypothetical protein
MLKNSLNCPGNRKLIALAMLGLAYVQSGCSNYLIVRQRCEYTLTHFGSLMASNSPAFGDLPTHGKELGQIVIPFSFIVKNISETESIPIRLSEASLLTNDESTPAICSTVDGISGKVPLPPGKSARVSCKIDLVASPENGVGKKDTTALIRVPFGSESEVISFKYFLATGDFK